MLPSCVCICLRETCELPCKSYHTNVNIHNRDNHRVKRQSLHLATVLATQLLLVDEVMRAGKQMGKQANAADMEE